MMNYTSLLIHEAIDEQEEKFENDKFKINKKRALFPAHVLTRFEYIITNFSLFPSAA